MKRTLLFSGIAVFIFFLLALVAALIWIPHWFLGSEAFRQEMNRQTSLALNIEGEWMPFRLHGWTLQSAGYDGTGSIERMQMKVRAENISFKINWRALLKRKWQIDQIEVPRLSIVLTSLSDPSAQSEPPPHQPAPSFPKIAVAFIPQTVDIREIILEHASVSWQTLDQQVYRLNELKSKSITGGGGEWSTAVTRGIFSPPDRHPWNLNSARLIGNLALLSLDHSEWLGADSGVIKISGPVMRNGKPDAELKLEGRGIPATSIVPAQWIPFIEGSVDSDATARLNANGVQVEGEATGKNIMLIGVPVLRSMQLATGLREWTELPLDTAWLKFKYTDNHLHVPASVFESKGMMRMEGKLSVENQQLSGTYQVGLAPRVVSKIPGASHTVFTLDQNEYYWAQPPMLLSGTTKAPKEDLSPRLKSAVFDAVEQKINQGIGKGIDILNSIFDGIQ